MSDCNCNSAPGQHKFSNGGMLCDNCGLSMRHLLHKAEAENAALKETAEKLVTSEVFSADKKAMIALLEQEGQT